MNSGTTFLENTEIFNRGIELLDLKVARLWSRSSFLSCWIHGWIHDDLTEFNPYRFGDIPASWTESIENCLRGLLSSGELFALPGKGLDDPGKFLTFGGQYGVVYFGRDVSFFIDGSYAEGEPPMIGEIWPANIAIPSLLLLEFSRFARSIREKRPKRASFHSTLFPKIEIAMDFSEPYAKFIVTPSLHEFWLCEDGGCVAPPKKDLVRIAFGTVSVPEAMTIGVVVEKLMNLPSTTRAEAVEYMKSPSFPDDGDRASMCDGMLIPCNDVISFVLAPSFSAEIYGETLPPAPVPTENLVRWLETIC